MNNGLNHEFCAKFRAEIKSNGLAAVISELIVSTSEKVALKKQYLARECRKNSFVGKFDDAVAILVERDRRMRTPLMSLRKEIVGTSQN